MARPIHHHPKSIALITLIAINIISHPPPVVSSFHHNYHPRFSRYLIPTTKTTPIPTPPHPLFSKSDSTNNSNDDDDDDPSSFNNNNNEDEISDDLIFTSLRKRQNELRLETDRLLNRWRNADFQSSIRLALDDWIRRLDMTQWPLVAVGSARGSIFVADLSTGTVLASIEQEHAQLGGDPNAIEFLHGGFDGGGTLAIATRGDWVISAGREGGAKAFRLDASQTKLIPLGRLSSLDGVLVTSLVFDDEKRLWVGCFDTHRSLRRFDLNSANSPLVLQKFVQQTPPRVWNVGSEVLDVAVCDVIGLVACATVHGSVELFSTHDDDDDDDDRKLASWKPFRNTHARSVAILETSDDNWCIVTGGGDGTMHLRRLCLDPNGVACRDDPFQNSGESVEMRPSHYNQVVSLVVKGADGILISASQDGTMKVWDCCPSGVGTGTIQPSCLYTLSGYKVWLGSVCTDGVHLVSDGSDNTVVVHDFSAAEEGDDDDDIDDE